MDKNKKNHSIFYRYIEKFRKNFIDLFLLLSVAITLFILISGIKYIQDGYSTVGGIILTIDAVIFYFLYKSVHRIPFGEEWVIDRKDEFRRICTSPFGFVLFDPIVERIKAKVNVKEQKEVVSEFEAYTKDKVFIEAKAFVLYKIKDAKKIAYDAPNYNDRIIGFIKGSIRNIIKDMTLDEALANRGKMGGMVLSEIAQKGADIGIEIRAVGGVEFTPQSHVREAIEVRAAAERQKMAQEIKAEAEKSVKVLQAKAELEVAKIHAQMHHIHAQASAEAIEKIKEVNSTNDAQMPLNYILGEKYLDTLKSLSESENSKFVVYPADLRDSMKGFMGLRAIDPLMDKESSDDAKKE